MYTLETGLEPEMGTNADELKVGDLGVVLHDERRKGHILLKTRGLEGFCEAKNRASSCLIDLTDPKELIWLGHSNLRVRKLCPGESITLTV